MILLLIYELDLFYFYYIIKYIIKIKSYYFYLKLNSGKGEALASGKRGNFVSGSLIKKDKPFLSTSGI